MNHHDPYSSKGIPGYVGSKGIPGYVGSKGMVYAANAATMTSLTPLL